MASTAQEKFTNLRKRLDQLGYRQPLGVESLPLVERLFADLLHTTESLKAAKLSSTRGPKEEADLQSQVEPYKNDNARLVKENNELHMKLISAREEADKKIADFKALLRKLEHENNDLRFLNNQYVHKVRVIERESKEKSDQILKLQEKNFNAVIQTPGGKRKHVPFRRQRLLLDSTLPASQLSTRPPISSRDDPFVADLLRVADSRIAELEKELHISSDKCVALDGKMVAFRRQVEARDSEIDRLNRMLDGGRPYDVVALEARNRSNEKLISHLNIQIDYLSQKNRDLEAKLEEAHAVQEAAIRDVESADLEKSALESSLKDADRTNRRLQQDKEVVVEAADRELSEAKVQLTKNRVELERQDLEIAELRSEISHLAADNSRLLSDFKSQAADLERLETVLDKVQEDKRKLGSRLHKLINTEKEMVQELDRLKIKRRTSTLSSDKLRNKSPNRFDQFLKNLEQERDQWKNEVERLQEILRFKRLGGSALRSPVKTRSRSVSPTRTKEVALDAELQNTKEELEYMKRENEALKSTSRSRSPTLTRSPSKSSDSELRRVMRERDELKVLLNKLELQMTEKSASRSMSPTLTRFPSQSSDSELRRITRERDELQTLLDKFEVQMAEIRSNVKDLTNERDRISDLYEEAKRELQTARNGHLRGTPTQAPSLATQHAIRRVEQERDQAIIDMKRVATERDSLRDRLRVATETQQAETIQFEKRLEEVNGRLSVLRSQKDDLEGQVSGLRTQVSRLEEEVRVQTARYQEARDESSQQKAAASQMRVLADEGSKSLQDVKQRLLIKEDEVQSIIRRCQDLEARLTDSDKLCKELKSELLQLKGTVSAIDREKDNLQSLLDDNTERRMALEESCSQHEERANQLLRTTKDLSRQMAAADDSLKLKDREIQNLRKQLDSKGVELGDVLQSREDTLRENRLLEEDLTNMTVENQRLNQDLQELIEERQRLADQVQEYVAEVKRVEDVLAQKEEERTHLLEQYRALSQEAERYETQTNQLEGETNNLRMELMSREAQLRRLEEQVELLDRECQQHQVAYEALESQIASQRRQLTSSEDRLRECERDRYLLQQDVAATRDLSARLESGKDTLQRRLAGKELDCERAAATIQELEREIAVLKERKNGERQQLATMEQLLADNREKEFQATLVLQESASELQLMRDRITLSDSKIDSQSREITQLRNRILELEGDIERSRRVITNERFERERTAQELRRLTADMARSSAQRSGQMTPVNQATPIKVFSPAESKSRTPTASARSSLHEASSANLEPRR